MANDSNIIQCTCLQNVSIFAAEYTISQGISPGGGFIRCNPSGNLTSIIGDLTLGCGSETVTIRGIVITDPSAANNAGGKEVLLSFQDARYWWRYGDISGLYNKRLPNGEVDPETEKTPQELATLLCQQIRPLATFDVSALPNDARPEVFWDSSNPADELAILCEKFNCVPNYWIDGSLKVFVKNQGAVLDPSLPSESRTINFTVQPRPDVIKLVGEKKRFQVRLPLEAVGLDIDGEWKLIDDMLIKPTDGWESESSSFSNVSETQTTAPDGSRFSPRERALQTVFRCYRVKDDLAELFTREEIVVPSGSADFKRKHVLPLLTTLVDEYTDTDGSKKPKLAFVGGVFWHEGRPDFENTAAGTKLDIGFSVDPETGIITLSDQVRMINDDGEAVDQPELWFYTACTLQDPGTRLPLRYSKEVTLPGTALGTGKHIIWRDDVAYTLIASYDDEQSSLTIDDVTENTAEIEPTANYYLSAAKDEFNRPDSAIDQLPWIITGYRIDGAIEQITWSGVSPGPGATTIVSRGTQHDLTVPSYKERQERAQRRQQETYLRDIREQRGKKR